MTTRCLLTLRNSNFFLHSMGLGLGIEVLHSALTYSLSPVGLSVWRRRGILLRSWMRIHSHQIRHTCVIFGTLLGYFLLESKVEEMLAFLVAVILSIDLLVRVQGDCSNSYNGFVLTAMTEAAFCPHLLALWGQEAGVKVIEAS